MVSKISDAIIEGKTETESAYDAGEIEEQFAETQAQEEVPA
jgi:hypothetical protein